ncbi:MAG: hypothetical protein ABIR67_02770 [Gaiellaceae bacterium]
MGATFATLSACLAVEPALAHLDLRPRLVEQGAVVDVRVELPQLRPGGPPRQLELAGPGIEVLSTRLQSTLASETVWSARLRADAAPGVVTLVLTAVYADGRTVEVDEQLTVVVAPPGSGFPWAGVVAGALLAVGFAAVSLYLARRRA